MERSIAVRPASEGDRATIATMLARAFAEDPIFSFILPDPSARQHQLPRLFSLLTASDLKGGRGFLVEEGAAVTLWRAPGRAKVGLIEMLLNGPALIGALRGALPRALRVSGAVEHRFPAEPFHYLHIAGCDPAAQGRGLGGAAIRAGLAAVPPGMPCYLETGTESNLGLYQRFGFAVSEEWRVPNGPRLWSMRRAAA
ncbi:GNAT family N-acetyltransferase [Sphingomonas sp. TDK1]|uniref:GNAT family N-acetyltransferase n=1 Tax=Sphingomonas sp. TDK1 TaxID=453247 RepID=UPI0007D9903A|nr:GNAT family N-acetyltransferase [Sphingomonas sp. TDK1]OAN64069.1 acetyltransferase [Sphingomonas sp. TDK1]